MPITYTYDPQRRFLDVSVSGVVRLPDVDDYFQRVSQEPWFPAASLTDVCQANAEIPSNEVRAIAALLRQLGPRLQRKPIAVLVGSDVAFGLVRMIGLLLDDELSVRPFRSRESAMAWLREQGASV